jgi:hypothetical protein
LRFVVDNRVFHFVHFIPACHAATVTVVNIVPKVAINGDTAGFHRVPELPMACAGGSSTI